eukprot:scaffold25694_cov127-Cylindrotheca_fusiformis.AAC.10
MMKTIEVVFLQAAVVYTFLSHQILAFQPRSGTRVSVSTQLHLAKKLRNKQADLAQKLALARKQAAEKKGPEPTEGSENNKLTDKEMQEKNDRLRFEELLKNQPVSLNDVGSDGYLNKQQEEAEITAMRKGADLLFEGDPAPSAPFENLVLVNSDSPMGESGAKRIVPWLGEKNKSEYLIVLCDPRVKSPFLGDATSTLSKELPKNLLSRTVIINADSPAENRRFCKKNNINKSIQVFSDEKRKWMEAYTALGEDRWTMTMIIIADERVQKIGNGNPTALIVIIRNVLISFIYRCRSLDHPMTAESQPTFAVTCLHCEAWGKVGVLGCLAGAGGGLSGGRARRFKIRHRIGCKTVRILGVA